MFFFFSCHLLDSVDKSSYFFSFYPAWMDVLLHTSLWTMHVHLVTSYIQILIGWSSLNTLFVKCIWDHFTSSPVVNSFPRTDKIDSQLWIESCFSFSPVILRWVSWTMVNLEFIFVFLLLPHSVPKSCPLLLTKNCVYQCVQRFLSGESIQRHWSSATQ